MSKRLKASERKATILAVAKVLFSDKGYHGVSVDEIARRLAVSPAILYRHFSSKEALYEEVLNEIACKRESYVEAVVNSDGSFADVLRKITRIYIESVSRDPDYLRMELQSALEGSDATRQFFENRWRPFTDFIEFSLKELAAENRVTQVNARVAALASSKASCIRSLVRRSWLTRVRRFGSRSMAMTMDSLLAGSSWPSIKACKRSLFM